MPAPATLLKKGLWHRCFRLNFWGILRTPFFIKHFRWLLLELLLAYSSSCNLSPELSGVLTGRNWFSTHPRHQRAATCLENVWQLNLRWAKKLGFQLLYRQPLSIWYWSKWITSGKIYYYLLFLKVIWVRP